MAVHNKFPGKAASVDEIKGNVLRRAEQHHSGSDPSSARLHLDPVSKAGLNWLNSFCVILGSCEDQKKGKEIKPQCPQTPANLVLLLCR